jgi:periplasmic protein TonB
MPESVRTAPGKGLPAALSIAGHAAAIAGFVMLMRAADPGTLPPAYAVELVAAPAGERAIGATETATTPPAPTSPAPAPPETDARDENALPTPAARPKTATATPPRAAAPTNAPAPATSRAPSTVRTPGPAPAGGGPTGGRGSDVVSVRTSGIAFPFPGYLENITRQIALNFKPRAAGLALRAEVTFLIRRDGSVSDLRMTSRSGTYAFDQECMGAVEAVGEQGGFGPLPRGFTDDVLPVVFSFDPRVLK